MTAPSRRTLLALGASGALTACAQSGARPAEPDSRPITIASAPAVQLPGSHQIDLRHPASANVWRIFVHVPEQAAPPGGYPVLYTLDGNATFFLAAQLARNTANRPAHLRPDPLLVVGIGNPSDDSMDQNARRRDYTPPPAAPDASTGGADILLDFIATQLQPAVASQWRVDAQRQTLFGHSLGGLFTLYAMASRPGLFTRHAAASPSLWWNDRQVLEQVSTWLDRDTRHRVIAQLRVGSLERPQPHLDAARAARQAERKMNEWVELLARRIQAARATHVVDFQELAGLDHGGVLAPALIDAVALAQREAI
ncbi:alpha/beta hydrolase-fold protein [Diaphorobacter sp.]|uniref:alpha/beta hydrolase n=1 Tax=Diaphorobacter sp. TaxID=1934310 RepID=UPI0028ADDA04|nr:alpha/beta hydrolase-fold protein [Diaphorobacter sp.]